MTLFLFKVRSLFLNIPQRRQRYLLKTLIPLILFIIILFLFLNRDKQPSVENDKVSVNFTHWNFSQRKIVPKSVLANHTTDEFLEIVLRQVSFIERNLRLVRQLNLHSNFDQALFDLEQNRVPGHRQNGNRVIFQERGPFQNLIFNQDVTAQLPLNRTVPDTRDEECRNLKYDTRFFPSMSVIIAFINEAFPSIIRLLHSLLNRTPTTLLKEIILVDDFSELDDLKGKLERYLATRLSFGKIRLLRLSKRAGLVKARMIGAHVAVGDVLVFLDAHCEVNNYWSEPLLERIKDDRTVVVCPVIDSIVADTLEYYPNNKVLDFVGGFKWSGHLDWIPIKEGKQNRFKPRKTPVMAGGLFAMDRKYFWEMGSYDPDMHGWGAENIEMSFRIWQCGEGGVEIIPCSRVGHIFRYDSANAITALRNFHRAAEVWMDEYKILVYHEAGEPQDIGDRAVLQKRILFRERKKCKSFRWYLENVYKDKFKMRFDSLVWGKVINIETNLCLDDTKNDWGSYERIVQVYWCEETLRPSQTFYLSNSGQLRKESVCAFSTNNSYVAMAYCEDAKGDAFQWDFDQLKRLRNMKSNKCLTIVQSQFGFGFYDLMEQECGTSRYQQWVFVTDLGFPSMPFPDFSY